MKYLISLAAALFLCTGAAGAFSVTRDTTFTGRGNACQTLLSFTQEAGTWWYRVRLDAPEGSVTKIRLIDEGKEIDSQPVWSVRDVIVMYGNRKSAGHKVEVAVDIAPDTAEGSLVTADLIDDDGNVIEADCDGAREVLLERTRLFAPGDFKSANWRIPAICALPNGHLVVLNDKRKYNELDLPEDIDVVSCRSVDGGHKWSRPVAVARGKGVNHGFGDPGVAVTPDGGILAVFCGGYAKHEASEDRPFRIYTSRSADEGRHWSDPEPVSDIIYGPSAVNPECRDLHWGFAASGNGLVLGSGRILFAVAVFVPSAQRHDNYVIYSDDSGRTWSVSSLAFQGGDEAKMVELPDGRILMSVRQNGSRGYAWSDDGGASWYGQGHWGDLVSNACNGDMLRYTDGSLLHTLPASMKREKVSVFRSTDGGGSWSLLKTLCGYESVYSSLTVMPDGTLGAYIEENPTGQCELWFMRFSWEWLTSSL